MNKNELIDKLMKKVNISYEKARDALENNNWDILDAVVYLEDMGSIEAPKNKIFYSNSNEYTDGNNVEAENSFEIDDSKKDSDDKTFFYWLFENICRAIDICNNIWLTVRKKNKLLFKLPLTVIILLLFFSSGGIIPLAIIGAFFEFKFELYSKKINMNKANEAIKKAEEVVYKIKAKIRKRGY